MATIHKRKLRSGHIVWELTHGTGADRRRFIAGHSQEEAAETLRQFNQQLALHGEAPGDDAIPATVDRYVAFLSGNRRPGTVRRYVRILKTFFRCFLPQHHRQIVRLRQIKPNHIEDYKDKRLAGGITEPADEDDGRKEQELLAVVQSGTTASNPRDNAKFGWLGRKRLRTKVTVRTINYELQALQTFFRWAIKRQLLLVDPTSIVERYRIPRRALPKFLTLTELKQLFDRCDPYERRLFVTVLLTGMRKGEVEHLTWSDVNLELGVIFIREKPEWSWKPKTDERIIPVSATLKDILSEHYRDRRSDTLVFANKEGNRDTHMLAKLQKICRRVDLKVTTVHALRHSFGAHLRMSGVSLEDIADLLGHRDLATTQIYANVHQEHLRGVVAKLPPAVDLTGSASSRAAVGELTDQSIRELLDGSPSINSRSLAIDKEDPNGQVATTHTQADASGVVGQTEGPNSEEDQRTEDDGGGRKAG